MLALVLMDHALRHRAQCGDVRVRDRRRSPRARLERRARAGAAPTRGDDVALRPFAAVSFCYFALSPACSAPYAPLWFQSLGYAHLRDRRRSTSLQSATRLFAPYAWGWIADHSGRREHAAAAGRRRRAARLARLLRAGDYAWVAVVSASS